MTVWNYLAFTCIFSASGAIGLSQAYNIHSVDHGYLFIGILFWWMAGIFTGITLSRFVREYPPNGGTP